MLSNPMEQYDSVDFHLSAFEILRLDIGTQILHEYEFIQPQTRSNNKHTAAHSLITCWLFFFLTLSLSLCLLRFPAHPDAFCLA